MSNVNELEQQLKDHKAVVERRDMALKLAGNREFKKLILEYLCVEESARYAHASADPMLDPASRADALNIAQAAGHLKRWLSIQVQMGNVSAREIGDIEQALEEERAVEDIEEVETH